MAQPFDSATTLQSLSNIIREQYDSEFTDQVFFTGRVTNRLLAPNKTQAIVGDGETFQVETAHAFNGRFDTDVVSDFPTPTAFQAQKLKVRFNEANDSLNDFVKFATTGRVSEHELRGVSCKEQAVDIADRIEEEMRIDYDFLLALHRNLDRTARVALINGTPRQNDADNFSSCSATPVTTMRAQVDTGPIAAFQPGTRHDFYSAAGALLFTDAIVTDYNPVDSSVGWARASAASSPSFATVVDNTEIYMTGERNKGMYSIGAWFSRPTSSDAFLGAVNRSTAANRYLNPRATRVGASSKVVSRNDIDDLANAMSYVQDAEIAVAIVTDPTMHTKLRNDIGEDAFIPWPSGTEMSKRWMHLGSIGLTYQHPIFGVVKIVADPLSLPNDFRVITPDSWMALQHGKKGLQFMPGSVGGLWDRMESATPGKGKGMFWQCQAYALHCDFCRKPGLQGRALNLTV